MMMLLSADADDDGDGDGAHDDEYDDDGDDDDHDQWLRAAAGLRITTLPPSRSSRWRQIRAVIGHRWKNIARVQNCPMNVTVLVLVNGHGIGPPQSTR